MCKFWPNIYFSKLWHSNCMSCIEKLLSVYRNKAKCYWQNRTCIKFHMFKILQIICSASQQTDKITGHMQILITKVVQTPINRENVGLQNLGHFYNFIHISEHKQWKVYAYKYFYLPNVSGPISFSYITEPPKTFTIKKLQNYSIISANMPWAN